VKLADSILVFVTGRGGAGFHSPDPALTRGPPALIPWTGPRLLPPIFNGDPSGVWVGRGPERGQGQGMPQKTPRPRPLSGAGPGKGPGARVFRGPVRPVTNSIRSHGVWYDVPTLPAQIAHSWSWLTRPYGVGYDVAPAPVKIAYLGCWLTGGIPMHVGYRTGSERW